MRDRHTTEWSVDQRFLNPRRSTTQSNAGQPRTTSVCGGDSSVGFKRRCKPDLRCASNAWTDRGPRSAFDASSGQSPRGTAGRRRLPGVRCRRRPCPSAARTCETRGLAPRRGPQTSLERRPQAGPNRAGPGPGRPRSDEPDRPANQKATALKGARYALWKNPADLTDNQQTNDLDR